MLHRIPLKVNDTRVTLELRMRLNKEDIAKQIRQGIDVEFLENQLLEEFRAYVTQIEKLVK